MFAQLLLPVYRLFFNEKKLKIHWIDNRYGFEESLAMSSDDVKNVQNAYEDFFSEKNRAHVDRLYLELIEGMKGLPYESCGDVLEALVFLQEISATALWKYDQKLSAKIEAFVKDFDRLDLPDERVRLYRSAQIN